MKKISLILLFNVFILLNGLQAQDVKKPDWRKLHYLSEEEMNSTLPKGNYFSITNPPADPRMPAEFEPVQGVLIRYPLGIPYAVVAELAEDTEVYTLVSSNSQANSVKNIYASQGIDTTHCTFVVASTNSYWVRDYGPWFIFNDDEAAIVDFPYDRPRPNDNLIPETMASFFNIELFGMNVTHTGGNMMQDGYGMAASTDLVIDENNSEAEVRQLMHDFLGIDNYHITIDPLDDYIKHIDCWGKFLAPDKILIASVPSWDYRYNEYEAVANYFDTTLCSYGYPYKVYRIAIPGKQSYYDNDTLAPYTNSLIANNKVLVPMGENSQYNSQAIATYQAAMPGYEIIGFENNSANIYWENTDALHCRTRGIVDMGMIFIDHKPLFGLINEDVPIINASIKTYSGENLISDSILVYYSINGGNYQNTQLNSVDGYHFTANLTGINENDSVSYFIFSKDASGRRLTQPIMAQADPHHFVLGHYDNLSEVTNNNIKLYPNPASNSLNIVGEQIQQIFIYNTLGQLVYFESVNSTKVSINVSGWQNGIYFVNCIDEMNNKTQRKVIIQK